MTKASSLCSVSYCLFYSKHTLILYWLFECKNNLWHANIVWLNQQCSFWKTDTHKNKLENYFFTFVWGWNELSSTFQFIINQDFHGIPSNKSSELRVCPPTKTSNTHSTSGCCLQWEEGTISIPFPAEWLCSSHGYLWASVIMETQHQRGHAEFLATLCQNIPDIGVWITLNNNHKESHHVWTICWVLLCSFL